MQGATSRLPFLSSDSSCVALPVVKATSFLLKLEPCDPEKPCSAACSAAFVNVLQAIKDSVLSFSLHKG